MRSPRQPRGHAVRVLPAQGALVVHDPGLFLFRGTGAGHGTTYAGLVGPEIDRAYPVAGTPGNLEVLAHSPVACGPALRTYSDKTYYSTSSGAGVFAIGSMLWDKAVAGRNNKYASTPGPSRSQDRDAEPLLRHGRRSDGLAAPCRGNFAALHVPSGTGTGTGGPSGGDAGAVAGADPRARSPVCGGAGWGVVP